MYWLQLVAASLHQACAGPGGAGACLGHASTLRYSDTLTSLLAVWVTVLAMAHLPPSLRSANHPTYLHISTPISTHIYPCIPAQVCAPPDGGRDHRRSCPGAPPPAGGRGGAGGQPGPDPGVLAGAQRPDPSLLSVIQGVPGQ